MTPHDWPFSYLGSLTWRLVPLLTYKCYAPLKCRGTFWYNVRMYLFPDIPNWNKKTKGSLCIPNTTHPTMYSCNISSSSSSLLLYSCCCVCLIKLTSGNHVVDHHGFRCFRSMRITNEKKIPRLYNEIWFMADTKDNDLCTGPFYCASTLHHSTAWIRKSGPFFLIKGGFSIMGMITSWESVRMDVQSIGGWGGEYVIWMQSPVGQH